MDRLSMLLEAERRGILPPDHQAMLDEARRRGLVSDPQEAPPTDVTSSLQAGAISAGRVLDRTAAGLRDITPAPIRNAVDSLGNALGMAPAPSTDPQTIANAESVYAPLEKQYPKATFMGDLAARAPVTNPIGMGIMAATEIGTPGERLARGGLAYGSGKLGEWIGGKIADKLASRAENAATARVAQQSQNAVSDQAAKAAIDAGYKLPPTMVNPTPLNRGLEGLAGKITTQQQLSIANQPTTRALLAKDIGLPPDVPLTIDALQNVRAEAGKAYDALSQAGSLTADKPYAEKLLNIAQAYDKRHAGLDSLKIPQVEAIIREVQQPNMPAGTAVELIKTLREEGFSNKVSQKASDKFLGRTQVDVADALENLIDRNLAQSGQQDLLGAYRAARQTIAKTYTIQKAINPSTGAINAGKLVAELRKGKPLSGGTKTVAEAAAAFPKALQEVTTSMPGVSPLDFAASLVGGHTMGGAGAGIPLARPLARGLITSGPYQAAMVKPQSYAPGLAEGLLAKAAANPEAMQMGGGLLGLFGQRLAQRLYP